MNLGELLRRRAAGEEVTVPDHLRQEYDEFVSGQKRLQAAFDAGSGGDRSAPDRLPPALPEDYEIQRELGRGGMGVVYLALQRSLQRLVAVKVLRACDIVLEPVLRRFRDEAKHLARLRHPNIVSVHETGEADGEPYFTMDYIEGESLAARLKRGRVSPEEAVRILMDVCAGVSHAHGQGIIHRDLKPANILLDGGGRAFVTDFGLARDVKASDHVTGSAALLGTPAYMAPEQADGQGDRIGPATDVWAIGVVLYEMLTGQRPFDSIVPRVILHRVVEEDPVPPRRVNPRIPRDLETVCLKALEKDPFARYASMEAFREDLRRQQARQTILARRRPFALRVARAVRKRWASVSTLAAMLALALLGRWMVLSHEAELVRQVRATAAQPTHERPAAITTALAQRLQAQKESAAAVKTYREAWSGASPVERPAIEDQMAACCADLRDTDAELPAWRALLGLAPGRSFGANDLPAALALVNDLKARFGGSLNEAVVGDTDAADLAVQRLRIWLDGTAGTEEERQDGRRVLGVLSRKLEELRRIDEACREGTGYVLCDGGDKPPEKFSWLEDATKAMKEGQGLEQAGDAKGALARYQQAFEWMRREHPYRSWDNIQAYGESRDVTGPDGKTKKVMEYKVDWDQAEEACADLNAAEEAYRRLASLPKEAEGGIELELQCDKLPNQCVPGVQVNLWADPIKPPKERLRGMARILPALPSFKTDGAGKKLVARVGVPKGVYHLEVGSAWTSTGVDGLEESAQYEMSFDRVETGKPVELGSGWKKVGVVVLRRLPGIALTAPAAGAKVDLDKDTFRWVEVTGAKYYLLQLRIYEDVEAGPGLQGGQTWFAEVQTDHSGVNVGDIAAGKVRGSVEGQKEELKKYRAVKWLVDAFDKDGRRLATSGMGRPFTLLRGLGEK